MAGYSIRGLRRSRIAFGALAAVVALTIALTGASSASAAEGPAWLITSYATPTNLPPAGTGELMVTAVNVGGTATDGSTITIRDTLPAGLVATGISAVDQYAAGSYSFGSTRAGSALTCTTPPTLVCTRTAVVEPGDQLLVMVKVKVEAVAPESVVNQASVSGGGSAQGASVSSATTVSAEPAGFGLTPSSVFAAVSSHKAGAHPDVTTGFALNTTGLKIVNTTPSGITAGDPRDIRFDLPPGLIGNTVGMPQCTAARASGFTVEGGCPASTVVGVASTAHLLGGAEANSINLVYNIEPSPGEPAAFLFVVQGLAPVRLDTSLLSDGNYAVRVTASNLNQAEPVLASYVTIWGVPADHQGLGPIFASPAFIPAAEATQVGGPSSSSVRTPLLSNPTQCSTSLTAVVEDDSWRQPGVFQKQTLPLGSMSDCGLLAFSASMSMLPDTLQAGAPAGYSLDLHVPQIATPDGVTQPYVKKVVTALPMGTVVSPSAAQGLAACSNEQFYGTERGVQKPALPGSCPRESQVGTVQIATPALPQPLTGEVYLASPECNPCTPEDAQGGRMVRLFVQVVGEGESGIVVKLEGRASINQQTGQVTATFDNNPQLPFSEFKLTLGGGSRATLANPRACGPATTTMSLTPWTTPFGSEISAFSTFEINQGCITPQFNPSFVAGTTSIQAGEFSPFTVSFGRGDSDEFLNGLQMQMPPGLLGSLSGVPLCKEPQAALGTCGQESLIGHTQVLTGPGATPFLVTGGQVFLSEGYKGAPFGLSIVVPTVAGPYTLAGSTGHGTVVVRAAINIDASTAALTVTSDPLPTAFDGIPLQLKVVNVTVDRPGFTFNPTNCNKLQIVGTLTSKESAGVSVSSPFQATNCAGLGFKPQFIVTTSGKTSRAAGASLDAKVIYPSGAKLANIAKVKVDLPKQLPSRLTTLQKACTAAVFQANPGACPAASVVGIAKASTPILPVPLTGPVYFVSHGGEAFPSLIVILQGYGVRVDLVGSTFISKQGITSSTFKQVPDVPINSFELYLPEGLHSALAANGNLCTSKLVMPTAFVGQNGATIHVATKIGVSGCPKAKAVKKKSSKKKAKQARKASHRHGKGRK